MRTINKGHAMNYTVDRKYWEKCLICQKSLMDIKKEFGGGNKYFSDAFLNHLKQHQMGPSEYFEEIVKINRPECLCGKCHQKSTIFRHSANIYWTKYKCGRNPGQQAWSEQAKETRKGSGNPMYGKQAWNKGLNIYTSQILKEKGERAKGKKFSIEHRKKLSDAAKKRLIPGHLGHHHTEETKEFLRKNTLRLIKEGIFKQTKTKPHIKMLALLDKLNIKYEDECTLDYWSFDIKLIDYNIYIEVDGDYFHSNPLFYPNGPETKTQKINFARDVSKNNYCSKNNITLIRFWENDINKNIESIEKQLLCILKK